MARIVSQYTQSSRCKWTTTGICFDYSGKTDTYVDGSVYSLANVPLPEPVFPEIPEAFVILLMLNLLMRHSRFRVRGDVGHEGDLGDLGDLGSLGDLTDFGDFSCEYEMLLA